MYESMDLADEVARKRFLGPEFLLWLWYRVEKDDNIFYVEDRQFELMFDDQLTLEVQLAASEQTALKGGSPAHAPEAYKALQHGKSISRARMRIAHAEREWVFMLNTDTFAMSGIKIPAVLRDADDDKIDERLYLIDELDEVWSTIYHQFLSLRLGDQWGDKAQEIRDWIRDLKDVA